MSGLIAARILYCMRFLFADCIITCFASNLLCWGIWRFRFRFAFSSPSPFLTRLFVLLVVFFTLRFCSIYIIRLCLQSRLLPSLSPRCWGFCSSRSSRLRAGSSPCRRRLCKVIIVIVFKLSSCSFLLRHRERERKKERERRRETQRSQQHCCGTDQSKQISNPALFLKEDVRHGGCCGQQLPYPCQ